MSKTQIFCFSLCLEVDKRDDDPEDPGMTVIHLELTCPVLPSERRSTPLFTMNAAKKPMSQSFLRQLFKALLQTFLQSEE